MHPYLPHRPVVMACRCGNTVSTERGSAGPTERTLGKEFIIGELLYHLDSITQKVLSENLRELESLGLIERICYQEVPRHVEYRLTETGKSLHPIFHDLIVWGLNYAQERKYEKKESVNGEACRNAAPKTED